MVHRLGRQLGAAAAAVAALACIVVAAFGGAVAHGAGGNVPCFGPGGGAAGLVAAIDAANASGGGGINLAGGCTYSLTSANNTDPALGSNGLPVITTPITINGSGSTIAGNNSNFRIIAISGPAGGSLTLNGVTVSGGNVSGQGPAGFGGGILNFAGTLTLNHSLVTGNTAAGAGGGIASGTMGPGPGATLTLNNSEVSWNTVPPTGMGGGGILSIAGILNVNNSTIDHNTASGGGGIASGNGNGGGPGSVMTINNAVISDNDATGGAQTGGAGISNGGTLRMNNTRLTGNDAGGGFGGGLLNHTSATLNNVTVTGNSAAIGAGIANANLGGAGATSPLPDLTTNNVDVTGNNAAIAGGGIANVAPLGGPLGSVTPHNTQVTGNTPNNCIPVGTIAGCSDTVWVFTGDISGANENPPVSPAGTGTAKVTWDTSTNQMTVDVTFSGLTTPNTAAHIHCCIAPPGNTGVATTTPTFTGFPGGTTAGTYHHTFDMTLATSYNPAFVTLKGGVAAAEAALFAGLQTGQTYLNIHTMSHPGGETRAFLREP